MRKVLMGLGVAVLCLPMLFVGWLVLAARSPRMDASTMKLSSGMRETVADVILKKVGYRGKDNDAQLLRVVTLDPQNANAWSRLCQPGADADDDDEQLRYCTKAATLNASGSNLYELGEAQDAVGNPCAAEESYTGASKKVAETYTYLQAMGKAALRCGKPYDARAGLQDAIEFANKDMKQPDQEQEEIDFTKADILTDQEYLVVTLDQLKLPKEAQAVCSSAHPDWAGCACKLEEDDVSCTERKH